MLHTNAYHTEEEYWCAVEHWTSRLEFTAPDTYNVERARGWVFVYGTARLYTVYKQSVEYTNSGSETSK